MASSNSVPIRFALGISICTKQLARPACRGSTKQRLRHLSHRYVPCHGLDGIGHDVEIPNIAGQHSVYLRNQLLAFKKGQRKHPEMRYIARETIR